MKKWFFKYDKNTKELVPGAVFIEENEQPANSTAVDPVGTLFPIWDRSKGSWVSDEKKLSKLKEEYELSNIPSNDEQLADLTMKVAKLQMQMMKGGKQ